MSEFVALCLGAVASFVFGVVTNMLVNAWLGRRRKRRQEAEQAAMDTRRAGAERMFSGPVMTDYPAPRDRLTYEEAVAQRLATSAPSAPPPSIQMVDKPFMLAQPRPATPRDVANRDQRSGGGVQYD